MTDLINEKYGIVRQVSPDKQTIKIKLPQGGFAKARNEGFDIGDKVCFVVGPSGHVIKVILKLVADVIVGVANSPLMQSALQSNEEVSDVHNPDTNRIEDDCPDSRPSIEECPDLYGRKRGADVEVGEDYPGPETWPYPTLWFEG